MTIGVAAICENGATIVAAADRREVARHFESELDASKIVRLSANAIGICSSSEPDGSMVSAELEAIRGLAMTSIGEIARLVHAKCVVVRHRLGEDYLKRVLGVGWEEYRVMIAGSHSQNLTFIAGELNKLQTNADVLVAGIDESAHLYSCSSGNGLIYFNDRGTVAVGSGSVHALPWLAWRMHSKAANLPETVYAIYESKRIAELCHGVGVPTDMVVLSVDRPPLFFTPNEITPLETAYHRSRQRFLPESVGEAIGSFLRRNMT